MPLNRDIGFVASDYDRDAARVLARATDSAYVAHRVATKTVPRGRLERAAKATVRDAALLARAIDRARKPYARRDLWIKVKGAPSFVVTEAAVADAHKRRDGLHIQGKGARGNVSNKNIARYRSKYHKDIAPGIGCQCSACRGVTHNDLLNPVLPR